MNEGRPKDTTGKKDDHHFQVEAVAVDSSKVTIETVIPTGRDDVKLRNARLELDEGGQGSGRRCY